MITLATLPQATAQEVFDQVARHLLTQKKKSQVSGADAAGDYTCLYRDPNGLKCAAGCLMSDAEYSGNFEDNDWLSLVDSGRVPEKHETLIAQLQDIHDNFEVDQWNLRLNKIARTNRLNCLVTY